MQMHMLRLLQGALLVLQAYHVAVAQLLGNDKTLNVTAAGAGSGRDHYTCIAKVA